mmetsp:Transcript_37703/g.108663  ORF Transcript_37703/g.108663 Transcript_37703/m.108663 type:complete len:664 (+) Transcript_37703:216-2207(+)
MVVPDGGAILEQSIELVPWMRSLLFADWDDLFRKDTLLRIKGNRLVPNGIGCPLDGRWEYLCRNVRQQVPCDAEKDVRGKVWISYLGVACQVLGLPCAQASPPKLLVGQLACHRHQANGSLQGRLDLVQDLLDLRRQVPPPGVHVVAQLRRPRVERHEHGADAPVRLRLLAPHADHLPEVTVPSPVSLNEQRPGVLHLATDNLQPLLADRLQLVVKDALNEQLCLEASPVPLNLHCRSGHPLATLSAKHSSRTGLDVDRRSDSSSNLLSVGNSSHKTLNESCILLLFMHPAPAKQVTTVAPLDASRRVAQDLVSPPVQQTAEGSLESARVCHHFSELLPCHIASPGCMNPRHARLQLLLVPLALELQVPLHEQRLVLPILAIQSLHIPHDLVLLDDLHCFHFPLYALASECSANVLLQQGQGLLLMCFRHDVRGVIRNDVIRKVEVVALSTRCKPGRLQTLQVPVFLRRLRQCFLEGVAVEMEPCVPIPGAVLVGLCASWCQKTPSVGEANIQERDELAETCRLGRRKITATRYWQWPMLLAASRLVHLQEVVRTEVVGALWAPHHGLGDATLAALHLHKAAVVPQELILLRVVEMFAESPDHRVHCLAAAGRQVNVIARVVPHRGLPVSGHGVAKRKHRVPVQLLLLSHPKLLGHVLDLLWR